MLFVPTKDRQNDVLEARGFDYVRTDSTSYVNAVVEDTWRHNPLPSMLRYAEQRTARRSGLQRKGRNGYEDNRVMLTPEEADGRLDMLGLKGELSFEDEVNQAEFDLLVDRKTQELQTRDTLERADVETSTRIFSFAPALAVSMADPINIAASLIPFAGPARQAAIVGRASGLGGRTAARAFIGTVDGAAGAALVEPLVLGAAHSEQAQYQIEDTLMNIAFGSIMGGGLHAGGGLFVDFTKGLQTGTPEAAFRTAVATGDPELAMKVLKTDANSSFRQSILGRELSPEEEMKFIQRELDLDGGRARDAQPWERTAEEYENSRTTLNDGTAAQRVRVDPTTLKNGNEPSDLAAVARYKERIEAGEELDPVVVYKTRSGRYIRDGNHKVEAHRQLGKDVEVQEVDFEKIRFSDDGNIEFLPWETQEEMLQIILDYEATRGTEVVSDTSGGTAESPQTAQGRAGAEVGRTSDEIPQELTHRQQVEAALEQGLPVPRRALRDYPDLLEKHNLAAKELQAEQLAEVRQAAAKDSFEPDPELDNADSLPRQGSDVESRLREEEELLEFERENLPDLLDESDLEGVRKADDSLTEQARVTRETAVKEGITCVFGKLNA